MNLRFFIVLLYCLCCIIGSVNAQFDPSVQVQRPAAETQAVCDFAEIPVDLHTGRVNIAIPLYTVQHGDIRIPITLAYHGGGIRVSDECGAVGLGWTLQVGGVVSRIVRGLPDDMYDTSNKIAGYNKLQQLTLTNTLHDFDGYINLVRHRKTEMEPFRWLAPPFTNADLHEMDMMVKYGNAYDDGHFDTSPDNYIFQVQGLSGAFVNKRGKIIMQTNSDCSLMQPDAFSYEIQDADGFRYVFSDREQQEYRYKVGYGWEMVDWETKPEYKYVYPSAWWLSQIISAAGDSAKFHYTEKKIVHQVTPRYGYTEVNRLDSYKNEYKESHFYNVVQQSFDTTFHQLLTTIETQLCKVIFRYEDKHKNVFPHLERIDVYALSDLEHPIEYWKFIYSESGERARLTQLTRYGAAGESQHYAFTYNNSTVSIDKKNRDHWGYFAPESTGRFPCKNYFSFFLNWGNNPDYTDRYADNSVACNNMLQSITYPLGYRVDFEWEPHTFSQFGQLGKTAYKEDDYEHTPTDTIKYIEDQSLKLCGKEGNEVLQVETNLNRTSRIRIDLSDYYKNIANFDTCIGDWDCNYDLPRPLLTVHKNGKEIFRTEICRNTVNRIIKLDADAGHYVFKLLEPRATMREDSEICKHYRDEFFNRASPDDSPDGYIHIKIGHEEYVPFAGGQNLRNVGGVRIKRITYRSNNTSLLTKEYHYLQNDNNSTSSGVLAYPPRYGSQTYFCEILTLYNPIGPNPIVSHTSLMLTLRSEGLPFVLNGGGHIEYARVVEDVVESGGHAYNSNYRKPVGRTVYEYWTAADAGCDDINDTGREYEIVLPADMLQLTSRSFLRGHLKRKIEYTDEIKTTDYTYDIQEATKIDTLTGAMFTIADYTEYKLAYEYQGHTLLPYKDIGIVQYRLIPYNKRIKEVRVTGDITNTFEHYAYASTAYSPARNANFPVKHSVLASDGDTLTEVIGYLPGTSKIQTLVTVRNGRVVDACRYVYNASLQVTEKYVAPLAMGSLPLFADFDVMEAASVLQESFVYYGNRLVEYTDHHNGRVLTWLWSYANTYPIAEIENADFQTVCNALGKNKVEQLRTALRPDMEQVDALRTALPAGKITTMTYCPLRGISSATDARGETVYYVYDGFGQLTEVYRRENGEKQVLEHYEYHWSY
ncbi:MAG: hypothetical protein ACI3Z5_02570 [Paludibacteraceae bacterium]